MILYNNNSLPLIQQATTFHRGMELDISFHAQGNNLEEQTYRSSTQHIDLLGIGAICFRQDRVVLI